MPRVIRASVDGKLGNCHSRTVCMGLAMVGVKTGVMVMSGAEAVGVEVEVEDDRAVGVTVTPVEGDLEIV
jgi:hypothetical protein